MLLQNNKKSVIADCEACDKTNVEVFPMRGNMLLCADCKAKDEAATERMNGASKLIEESRKIDNSITLKTDVFLARTVAATELRGAINADESIPAEEKEYAYAKECMARFQNLQRVIFEKRAELLESENELRMWQVNVQTAAGKLRSELRQQFREVDINYQPATITKKEKTTKPTTSGKKFDKTAVFEAAKKYNVPAAQVQSIVVSRNMTPEDAAKHLAQLMGLIESK